MFISLNRNARGAVTHFFCLLTVVLLSTLTGCKVASEGSVLLLDETDTPYSFAEATVTLFPLEPAVVTPGQTPTSIGTGIVAEDGTTVTLRARRAAIREARFYLVEIKCPVSVPDDDCAVDTPLHVVLPGAQLRAGGWQTTVLTEAAYQNAAYVIAADYAGAQIQQTLDNAAAALITAPTPDVAADYADLLAWNPTDTTAVRRPGQLADFNAILAAGSQHNAVQLQAQQLVNVLVGSLALDGYVQDVAVAGERAYLVGSTYDLPGVLHVVDISDPSQPVLITALNDLGKADALTLAGDYAYVVDGGNYWSSNTGALRIISLANPDQPDPVANITISGRPTHVAIAANFAFVSQRRAYTGNPGFAGLQIINISNPESPVNAGSLATASGLEQVVVSGDRAYATADDGLYIIDISNPAAPVLVDHQIFDEALNAIAVEGRYAYVQGSSVLRVIDIENPSLPVVGSMGSSGGSAISLMGNRLYIGNSVIDISSPFAPQLIGRLATGAIQVVQPNGLAYLAAGVNVNIYDTGMVDRDPVQEGSAAVNIDYAFGIPGGSVAANGFVFAPDITSGLAVFDLSNPLQPHYVGTDIFNDYVTALAIEGAYGYTADIDGGSMRIMDVSDPAALEFEFPYLGAFSFSDSERFVPNVLIVDGQYVYVAYHESLEDPDTGEDYMTGGLYVLDVQSPSNPQLAALYEASTSVDAMAISGHYAYLIVGDESLEVIDISNPSAPALVTSLSLPGPVLYLTVSGNVLYASAGGLGIHTISIADPLAPELLATLDTPGHAGRLVVAEDVAYVSDGSSGVQVVRVGNPAAPVLIGAATTMGSADGVFLYDDYLYANSSYGFEMLRKLPAPVSAP